MAAEADTPKRDSDPTAGISPGAGRASGPVGGTDRAAAPDPLLDPDRIPTTGSRSADLGGRRLIDLRPDDWLRFATGRPEIRCVERLDGRLQWVGRETDVLLRAQDPEAGEFLVNIELQLRPDPRMPLRVEAYAALAEQKYRLPVYSVVVNILPGPGAEQGRYESSVLGSKAFRDIRVVRLWEWEARRVVDEDITGLLPLVPVMDGGDDLDLLAGVLDRLRSTPELAGMEMFLAYIAGLVLDKRDVLDLMRWNMGRATGMTFYEEILLEGREQGLAEGEERGHREAALRHLQRILRRRFGPAADALADRLSGYDRATLEQLLDEAIDAGSLAAFEGRLPG